MPPKRKKGQSYNSSTPAKRRKKAAHNASPHPHGKFDKDQEFKVRTILQERVSKKKFEYLIDWEDDEATGAKFDPTWEPEDNVNEEARADWEAQKAAKKDCTEEGSHQQRQDHARDTCQSSSTPQQTESPASQPIEIGESPEVSQVSPDPDPDSLFVPLNGPNDIPSQDRAFVRPSAPPSTWQTYNDPISSQAAPGASAPGSSQIQHPPKSTAEESETPAVLATSPNFLSQSAPPISGTGRVVPDSQSLLTSLGAASQTPRANVGEGESSALDQLLHDLQASAEQSPRIRPTSPAPQNSAPVDSPAQPLPESPSQRQSLPGANHKSTEHQSSNSTNLDSSQVPERNAGPPSETVLAASGNPQIAADFSSQIEHREPKQSAKQQPSHTATQATSQPETNPPVQSTESASSPIFDTQIASSGVCAEPRSNSHPAAGLNQILLGLFGQKSRAASVPIGDTSTSTHFPSIPSQLIPAIGESAPPHPNILSTPTRPSSAEMEQNTPTSNSTEELHRKLRAMRARKNAERREQMASASSAQGTPAKPSAVPPRLNAELAAEAPGHAGSSESTSNGARSPSTVPAALPVDPVTQEEQNTSERYKTLLPQPKENSSLRRQSTITGSASKEHSKPGNYVHSVPIALKGHQRDAYPTMIQQHKDLIERFLNTSQPGDILTTEIEMLLEQLRRIVVHPDLVNSETWTQYDVPSGAQAQWAIDSSSKFAFLKHLIDELRDKGLSIAVICQTDHLLQIMEDFLDGFKVTCYRADTGNRTEQDGCKLTFNIMTPNEDASLESLAADVVVCMDKSAEAGGPALKLLQDGANKPLIMTFVIPGTIEHVERCLSPDLTQQQRLRATMHGVFDLRYDAGKLEHGQLPSVESAKVIAEYIKSTENDKEWSIAALTMLENLDSQTESDIAFPASGAVTHAGDKRSFETSDADLSPTTSFKRPRIEPNGSLAPDQPTTINPQQLHLSHISDSVGRLDSSNMDSADLMNSNKRLQALLFEAQAKLAAHEKDLSELQYRYEEQSKALHDTRKASESAMDTASKAGHRMTEGFSATTALRAEVRALKEERNADKAALADHSIPERAVFEQQRIALAKSEAEKKQLEERLKNQENELQFARDLYQTASSSAQRLGTANKELENALAHAQNRASGEQTRAKQMTLDARAQNLDRENKQLKAQVKTQHDALQRKDKELVQLKEASRGRMGTRGSSVPRSPRMSSPLNSVARGAAGASRQSSPAAGELRGRSHPLRQG
ncbi:hypothetical protein Q7P37_000641 [Cladosporium fusiforme]